MLRLKWFFGALIAPLVLLARPAPRDQKRPARPADNHGFYMHGYMREEVDALRQEKDRRPE